MRWTFALTFVILGGWMLCPAERNLLAAELLRISAENYRDVLPEGKEVDAIAGDWILRNEQVLAVIAQPQEGRNANMTVRGVGGMLIDFTRRFHGSDQLSCFYPAAGRFHFAQSAGMSCQVDGQNVDLAAAGGKSGQTVRLSFQGTPVAADGTRAEVTYTLREDADWLEYQVTLINDAQAPVPLPIQDSLRCDGKLFSMHNDSRLKIFTATDSYFGQCYAFQLDEGLMQSVGSGRNLLLQPAATTDANSQTPPPAQIRWSGKIHCSQGLPGARSWAEGLLSEAPRQTMQLKLQSPHGPVPHATVEFLRDGQSLGHIQSDSQGLIRADLLQGGYTAVIRSLGRDVREHNFSIDNSLHADSLSLPAASRVRATILDAEGQPIAAKVQFQGIDGTSDPDFGPTAGIAAIENVVYCARGQFEQPLDPGRYRVIISHGPEFDAETQEIEIGPGQLLPLRSVLPRTVDTRGWVSSDFHSHSSPSGDNVSHQRGRVLNLLAEHIEFAPCTEHNRIDTYADDLLALNATAALATCSGMELTGSPLPINHQNAFPLHRHEHQQDGGGPQTDADPVRQIERLALWDNTSAKVVQMNHPNIPQILGDKDLDGRADEGLRGMLGWMDVIEVHPPQGIFTPPDAALAAADKRQNPIFYWLQLLNLGYRIPGVVNTDAHENFHGSGWLRNYLQCSTDDPAQIPVEEMIHAAEHGHVLMTTGPFLQAELRVGSGPEARTYVSGDDVSLEAADGPGARLWIRVQCPNWFDINRVQVFANGRPLEAMNFTRQTHAESFHSGAVRFERELDLPRWERDTHLIVATVGEGLKLGPVMGPQRGELPPVAVTNPIFVDIDGSGFQANGDDLGIPFMLPE